jgi:putative holliday junction resolvase
MAVDLGKARIGVAVSDELGLLAHPRENVPGDRPDRAVKQLTRLAREEGVTRFLVGFPLALTGEMGVAARRAARFCQRLADASGLEVELVDERLTTRQATRALREAGASDIADRVDGASAAILLQQWLDAHRA